jgi:hypothetical protein
MPATTPGTPSNKPGPTEVVARWVGNAVRQVGNAIRQTVDTAVDVAVGRAVLELRDKARQVGNTAHQVGNAARQARDFAVNVARQVGDVAVNAARQVGNAARQVRDFVVNVARQVGDVAVNGARWVENATRPVRDFVVNVARQVRDVVVNAPRQAENTARLVGSFNESFKLGVARYEAGLSPSANPASPVPTTNPELARDAQHNGTVHRVTAPGVTPNAGPPVVVVNGINTTFTDATRLAQEVSRLTGRPAELVYNNSDPAVAAGVSLGRERELARARAEADYNNLHPNVRVAISREDFILGRTARYLAEAAANPATADRIKQNELHNPPAAQEAANRILTHLAEYPNERVPVLVYSQGAAISAEALRLVERELVRQHGRDVANQMLARVQVLTLGGAADADDFPAAVNVTSIAHRNDIVSQYFGANRDALGRGNVGDFFNFVFREGFGIPQHTNYLGPDGNPEVARRVQDWIQNPAAGDHNVILPDYRP